LRIVHLSIESSKRGMFNGLPTAKTGSHSDAKPEHCTHQAATNVQARPPVAIDATTRELSLKKIIREARWLPPDPSSNDIAPELD
jgi:hypothetical protein